MKIIAPIKYPNPSFISINALHLLPLTAILCRWSSVQIRPHPYHFCIRSCSLPYTVCAISLATLTLYYRFLPYSDYLTAIRVNKILVKMWFTHNYIVYKNYSPNESIFWFICDVFAFIHTKNQHTAIFTN